MPWAEPDVGRDDQPEPEARAADATQRPDSPAPPLKRFPYDNGMEAALFLNRKMNDTEFLKVADEVARMADRRRESAGVPAL
ncbi:hypothetical protein ACFVZD_46090 [Streptomyces sp. NPDC058287]|uniref:hypothetical protein n=1 Tax=Streptomyces sp. NPDC058287 TaxID=3346423 RepID=UPI0036E9310A